MAALPHLPVSLLTAERDESGPVLRGEGEWAKEAATANPTWAGLVSVILPTLNEECIDASLQKLTDHLLRIDRPFEILIVHVTSRSSKYFWNACTSGISGRSNGEAGCGL